MMMAKDRIMSIRMTEDEYDFFKARIGNTMPSEFARQILLSPSQSGTVNSRLILIHENQKKMSKLSNENKQLWAEIRKELNIH